MNLKFVPSAASDEMKLLTQNKQKEIQKEIQKFYQTIVNYIETWEESFDNTEVFNWMTMTSFPEWTNVLESYEFSVSRFGQIFRNIVDQNFLCDEYGLMREFCLEQIPIWFQNRTHSEAIWVSIFQHFKKQNIQLLNMEKLVEYAFSIPGTSTEVERIFSIINRIWPDEKSSMDLSTVNNLLSIQYDSKLNCTEFYNKIKTDRIFMTSITSKNKY